MEDERQVEQDRKNALTIGGRLKAKGPDHLVRTRQGIMDTRLGRQLFQYRLDHGLSQKELAAKIGTHQATVSVAERSRGVSVRIYAQLCAFLRQEENG